MLTYIEINIKIHLFQVVKSPKTIDGIYSVTLPVIITVTLHTVTQLKSKTIHICTCTVYFISLFL